MSGPLSSGLSTDLSKVYVLRWHTQQHPKVLESHYMHLFFLNFMVEHLRTQCDYMSLVFAIDEYTDRVTSEVVRQYFDVIIDALRNPAKPRPSDEVVLGVITQE